MNDNDKPKSGPAFPRVTSPVFWVPISPVQAVEGVGRCAPGNNHHKYHYHHSLHNLSYNHHHDHLNHITVATGRWLVVLQGRTTEEPRLPKISPGSDDYYHCGFDGDNDVCGNLNKGESVVGSWMEPQYATGSTGQYANMAWQIQAKYANMGPYRWNIPIWADIWHYANIGRYLSNMLI